MTLPRATVALVVSAAPTTLMFIEEINKQILTNNYYKALKEAKKLIEYEKDLLDNV